MDSNVIREINEKLRRRKLKDRSQKTEVALLSVIHILAKSHR